MPDTPEITSELLARYDVPGPRYTSYPTAVEFGDAVGPGTYEEALSRADERADDPLSIYLHLPFCEHRCLFCGCHVIVTPHHERAMPYLDLLRAEIDIVAGRLPRRRNVSQIHLGGGTPTYFSPEQLTGVLRHLLSYFKPRPDAELALEADPRVTTEEHIDALAEQGFNRISFGVQDFTEVVQKAVEREQTVEQTERLVARARSRGFGGVNVDLIYGLPHQTPESFGESVDEVIRLRPDRTAVYSFAFVPWMRAHMKHLEHALPDRDTKYALFAQARERFLAAGYEAVGMDHFALADDELIRARHEGRLRRNFQGYTVVPAPDVVGLGISAIGDISDCFVQNVKKLSDYRRVIGEGTLPTERGVCRTRDDTIRRRVIETLMCNGVIPVPRIEAEFGIAFADYFAEDLALLQEHVESGLVTVGDDRIEATPLGNVFVRNLAMCFDRYLRDTQDDESKPRFSRTV